MAERETRPNRVPLIVLAWAWVVLPFAYGVYQLFLKLVQLFGRTPAVTAPVTVPPSASSSARSRKFSVALWPGR
ncbi:hypothetical protein, partial [Amycolatopsis sp. NPDC051128]|uniref:MFS transporter small subunit n=1 Tax=Amycolatopsis sp. NPDC051128 TaxID=3155412 RepID=UPI00341F7A01